MAEGELTPKEIGGFRILRRLASGANSDVLLARAEGPHGFQRTVALKILLSGGKGDADFDQRFAAAAGAYARLSHPAIVKLYDFFTADGQSVMVLEHVDGLPLHKLRAMLAISGERIEDTAAVYIAVRVFSALAAAHAARDASGSAAGDVVHGDVNPSNILVPWDGQAKLGDFGMARALGSASDPRAGFIKGTYGYGAPEQVAGGSSTPRADVYAAGLILWELLARRKAVQRGTLNDAQVVKAMTHPEFPALELLRPDLERDLRSAVRRATEPDPEKRTITAAEVVDVLSRGGSVNEGRDVLVAALDRVRPAGAGEGRATGAGPTVSATLDSAAAGVGTGHMERLDPEQTAPFEAIIDDTGDLGKIAFYGKIRLPPESMRPRPAPPRPSGSTTTRPEPAPATSLEVRPDPFPSAPVEPKPGLPSTIPPESGSAMAPVATEADGPLTPARPSSPPRPAPRALAEAKPEPSPQPPAPTVSPEPPGDAPPPAEPPLPEAALSASVEATPAPVEPAVSSAEHSPQAEQPATKVEPVVPAPAEPPPPRQETATLASAAPEPAAAADVPVEVSTSEEPPPPPLPQAKFPWAAVAVVSLVLATGAAVLWLKGGGESEPNEARSTSGAPPTSAGSASSASVTVQTSTAEVTAPAAVASSASTQAITAPASSNSSTTEQVAASANSTAATTSAAAVTPARPPPAAPSATEPTATGLDTTSGQILPPASAAGHRIFVDGKVASEGTDPIRVHCGSHMVRVGSAGDERKVDVPCGGSVKVGP